MYKYLLGRKWEITTELFLYTLSLIKLSLTQHKVYSRGDKSDGLQSKHLEIFPLGSVLDFVWVILRQRYWNIVLFRTCNGDC